MRITLILALVFVLNSCKDANPIIQKSKPNFSWHNATIYFLMTDRFYNGDKSNDYVHDQNNPPAPYRGYMGGDIKGITDKIESGYFTDLGVNAIWMTPIVEQIDGSVDEGTGNSFGFHGYWTRDWTRLDEKFGTEEDLKELVEVAHDNGIRILIDVVANHTGPVTREDSVWPESWVKTEPQCTYTDYASTVNCTLVKNLPDIKTESDAEVELPPFLVEKWKSEGRYEQEVSELDEWFSSTGFKRTPVHYILKWLVDFIKEYGVDGYRVDTVKHTEGHVWEDLYQEAVKAWEGYKKNHPESIIDPETPFYMVGEVYNYYVSGGKDFDYGDQKVDFYDQGFDALINFDFKSDAHNDYEMIFSKYDKILHGELSGKTILNYISSHDDGGPFDKERKRSIESGTKLLLCQGGAQIYYGDETARSLSVEADGDAVLRSYMNWGSIENNDTTKMILQHWQKLGKFRNDHIAIGAGRHHKISDMPYTFSRKYETEDQLDVVVVALDAEQGEKEISVEGIFEDGTELKDGYSGKSAVVKGGKLVIDTAYDIVLLAED